MVNLSTIGQVASAAPQGYEQYQDRRLAEAVRRLALQAQREKLEEMAMDRGAMGAAFAGFMQPDANGAPALPGSMPMPGPVPMGPGEASVPRAQAQPPAPSPAPQENPTTGLQPGTPNIEPSRRGAAGGGAPNVPNGTQVNFQAAQQGLQNYDLRTLAAKIKEANPGIDNQTAFRALAQMSNMLSRQQQLALRYMLQNKQPAAIEEYLFYSQLTPEQQGTYDRARRAQPFVDLGNVKVQPGGSPNNPSGTVLPVGIPPAEGPENAESVAAARARGTSTGTAQTQLSGIENEATMTENLIDAILNDPALPKVVGLPESVSGGIGRATGTALPGSPEAGFIARVNQLKGRQFLEAFNTLKGGGQITEVEGKKATDAISTLTDLNQSEADYRKAAADFKAVIRTAVERARAKARQGAGGGASAPAWTAPAGLPDASGLADGTRARRGGNVIAVIKGGKWAQP